MTKLKSILLSASILLICTGCNNSYTVDTVKYKNNDLEIIRLFREEYGAELLMAKDENKKFSIDDIENTQQLLAAYEKNHNIQFKELRISDRENFNNAYLFMNIYEKDNHRKLDFEVSLFDDDIRIKNCNLTSSNITCNSKDKKTINKFKKNYPKIEIKEID